LKAEAEEPTNHKAGIKHCDGMCVLTVGSWSTSKGEEQLWVESSG